MWVHCLKCSGFGVRFKCPKKNKAVCHFTPCVILSCVCNQSSVVVRQIAGSLPTFVVGMTKDMDHYEAHPVDTCLLQSYSQEATQVWQWIYDYEPLFLLPLLRRIWIYVVYFVAGNYFADCKWPLFQKQLFDDRGKWQFDTLVLEDKVPSSLVERKLL